MLNAKPLTWHDVDTQALYIAGDNTLVNRAQEVFGGYDNLTVKKIDRLKLFDPRLVQSRQGNSIYGMSMGKLIAQMPELFPNGAYNTQADKNYSTSRGKLYIEQVLDTGEASSFATWHEKDIQKDAQGFYWLSAHSKPNKISKTHALVAGYDDMATRYEILGTLAGMHARVINAEIYGSLAEMQAFVDNHEFQHARSRQTWLGEPDFFNPTRTAPVEVGNAYYKPLKEKAGLIADPKNDPYAAYLSEQVSDAVAALHHLKNGGDVRMLQQISDARAMGAAQGQSPVHHTTSVLDSIIENEQAARKWANERPADKLDDLGVYMVGKTAWTRDQYYAHVAAACFGPYVLAQNQGETPEKLEEIRLKSKENAEKLITQYSDDPVLQQSLREQANPNTYEALRQRAVQAHYRLVLENKHASINPHDRHLVEIQAAVKHNQAQHPEFDSPEGAQHLLQIRERRMRANKSFDAFEEHVSGVLKDRYAYQAAQQIEKKEKTILQASLTLEDYSR